MNDKKSKQKVIILGGGVSGCSAAYWLTYTPEMREKYEIHLYQSGWRLGGKGASGRNPETKRSYEHGPHAWYGGYENGFRMLRDVYQQYFERFGQHGKFSNFFGTSDDAVFHPATESSYFDPQSSEVWKWLFPSYPLGQDGDGSPPPRLWDSVKRVWQQLKDNLSSENLTHNFVIPVNTLLPNLSTDSSEPQGTDIIKLTEDAIHNAMEGSDDVVQEFTSSGWIFNLFREKLNEALGDPNVDRRTVVMLDFLFTLTVGTIKELKFNKKNIDDLNGMEFQEWLKEHGAKYPSAEDSPYISTLYDAAFAFKDGKTRDMAAGTALRVTLWIFFGYKSNYIYKMQAGMGEVVFSPIYKLLCEKNGTAEPLVNAHFFQRVIGLELDDEGKRISKINMQQQAKPIGEYDPLIDAKMDHEDHPFWCWPDAPKWDDLENGSTLSKLDSPGVDLESRWTRVGIEEENNYSFDIGPDDLIIFALPAPVLPELVTDLASASPRFAKMLDTIDSVQTSATQLWIKKSQSTDSSELPLGYEHGMNEQVIMGGADNPLSIHLDYSPTLSTEKPHPSDASYDPDEAPQHLLYSCGVLPDSDVAQTPNPEGDLPHQLHATLEKQLGSWLNNESTKVFPLLADEDGNFDWSRIGDPNADYISQHYHRVNFDGHSRYILSTTNSIQHRLRPNESGFDNLTLAGDWTKTGIDLGCVEASVISGMLAVEAISGEDLGIKLPLQ